MNKKELKKIYKESDRSEIPEQEADLNRINKLKDRYITKRDDELQQIHKEYIECKQSLNEFDEIVKDCEIKIKRAEKGKATRLRNLEAAIREFESKDESNTTDEDRAKFYKNVMEYSKKTAPNRLKAKRRRSRKTKVELLEETKQKIAETMDKIKSYEEKMSIYEEGKSHEDLMIMKLDDLYQRVLNGESWEDIKHSEAQRRKTQEENKTIKSQTSEEKKENKEIEQTNLEKRSQEVQDKKQSSEIFQTDKLEARRIGKNKPTEELLFKHDERSTIIRFKNAVYEARKMGFTDDEIAEYILNRTTSGMDFERVRGLITFAVLIDQYEGDLSELVPEILYNTPYPALRFEQKHPIIAKIPLLGSIIKKISNRRAEREEWTYPEERYLEDIRDNSEIDKNEAFRRAIKVDEIPEIQFSKSKNTEKREEKDLFDFEFNT